MSGYIVRRQKKPNTLASGRVRRAGDVASASGTGVTINLDAGSRQQIVWQQHVIKRLLGGEAGNSVLVRRALTLYTEHLEKLLKRHSADGASGSSAAAEQRLGWEVIALKRAAAGERDSLPEQDLIAVPIKPFSEIKEEQRKREAEKAKKATLEPFDPDKDGHE
jgi:hypothetical protein